MIEKFDWLSDVEKEFIASALYQEELSLEQLFEAAYKENFILCFDLKRKLGEMLMDGLVKEDNGKFHLTDSVKIIKS